MEGLVEMSSVGMLSWEAMAEARVMSSSDQQMIRDGVVLLVLRRVRICRLREFGFASSGVK